MNNRIQKYVFLPRKQRYSRIIRRLRAKRGSSWRRKGYFIAKGLQNYRCRTGGVIGEKRSVVATPKGLCFRLFCCDNLIKWNIKCVIFWVRKRGEKGGGTLQYC